MKDMKTTVWEFHADAVARHYHDLHRARWPDGKSWKATDGERDAVWLQAIALANADLVAYGRRVYGG